jgi:hypothetical protein
MLARSRPVLLVAVVMLVFAVAVAPPAQERAPATPPVAAPPQPLELSASELRGREYTGSRVETPRGLDGKPDLTGYWRPLREAGKPTGNLGKDEPRFILPFSDLGRRAVLFSQNHTVDPEAECILGGIPRHNGSGLPFEILHTPQRLATLYYYNTHRWVSIDENRTHPESPEPRYFGSALGRWEGDTLVIETVGLRDSSRDRIWLDENGNPTSDQTRVTERWTRPDFHHITVAMTVTDLKYYTRPFTFTRSWVHGDPGQGLAEYACNENNIDAAHIGPGAGAIGPDGTRGYGYQDLELPAKPPGPEAYGL